jgi:murein DD-endopeptidase MepM/ murein hydrolase activator NlpD
MRLQQLPRVSIAAALLAAALPGCAGVARTPVEPAKPVTLPAPAPTPRVAEPAAPEADVPEGVFHVVTKGQTLWRIARAYGVTVEELEEANGITDVTKLETDRVLFVPRAATLLDVPPFPAPLPGLPRAPGSETLPAAIGGFEWPVRGGAVLSHFGVPRRGHRHAGIDIRGERGQEILAARAGTVVYAGDKLSGYGKLVIVDHGDGMQTLYAHGLEILVREGDEVAKSQPIALVGRTGNATTEHCHFEIRKDRVPVDPLPYLAILATASAP